MALIFWLAMFGSSTHRRWKILRKFWVRNMSFLCKNIDLKISTFFYLTLTWIMSKVNFDDVIGSNAHHYRYLISTCKMTKKTCVARHVCNSYFLVNFCDLTSALSGMTFVPTHTLSFSGIYQHFVWVWALCRPSNRLYSTKCESSVFYI